MRPCVFASVAHGAEPAEQSTTQGGGARAGRTRVSPARGGALGSSRSRPRLAQGCRLAPPRDPAHCTTLGRGRPSPSAAERLLGERARDLGESHTCNSAIAASADRAGEGKQAARPALWPGGSGDGAKALAASHLRPPPRISQGLLRANHLAREAKYEL